MQDSAKHKTHCDFVEKCQHGQFRDHTFVRANSNLLDQFLVGQRCGWLQSWAEFSLPLLLIHGKKDRIAFPSSSTEFAAPLRDKCTLMLWDGLYREVHNEPEKADVLSAMTIWMDARLA